MGLCFKINFKNIKTNLEKYGGDSIQPYSYSGTLGMLGYWGMSRGSGIK